MGEGSVQNNGQREHKGVLRGQGVSENRPRRNKDRPCKAPLHTKTTFWYRDTAEDEKDMKEAQFSGADATL